MNSNRKSRERSDDLRRVDPYKRSTKDKQSWQRGGLSSRQYTKLEDMA